jgi:hypothetical protein
MLFAASLMLSFSAHAFAQGSFFTSLSGTVTDTSGAVIPGANVQVKNIGTGETKDTVSGTDGGFTVASIPGGTYSVTVSLMGFKTAVLSNVLLNASIPANVKVTLQVGALEENVTVVGDSALVVQTSSPAIATNLTGQQIQSLPLTSRNALDSLTSLAGFNTSGTARDSTVSGLPKSAINITLDGMNVQDNYLKTSDGYFARLAPLLDSVEEVTVTTAGNTADATGQGGVQIKFVTKSGTNNWTGTAYEYFRHDALNANDWFRNRDLPPDPDTGKAPKNKLRQYQQGFAQGGPIKPNKAFFFFNYEELRSPAESTRQRVVLTPQAASGTFSYNSSTGVRSVNLLQLAAANGQLATLDPTVSKTLSDIAASTATQGTLAALSNPLVQQYTFSTPTTNFNPSPTVRIDYEVSQNHRLTGSMNYRHINSTPDTTNNGQVPFPGFPNTGSQQSTRWTTSESLRSTFGQNLVNEARFGGTGGATLFSPELTPSMFDGTGGYRLNFANACCGSGFQLTNIASGTTTTGTTMGVGTAAYSAREAGTRVIEDNATWIHDKHSVTFGGTMLLAKVWLENQTLVPTIAFDVISTEPAAAMFSAPNFPGASNTDLAQARQLYAILTGRVSSITGDARITPDGSQYVPLGKSRAEGNMREWDFYAADTWRIRNNVTLSGGLRYVLQQPFYPVNNSYTQVSQQSLCGVSGTGSDATGGCNLFMPGTLGGAKPVFTQYGEGTYAYNTDGNNLAPSIGAAWQIPGHTGAMGKILGADEGDSVIRAGFGMAYNRPGMSDFTGVFGANRGILATLDRSSTLGNLGTLPLLLRNKPTLQAAPAVTYPIAPQQSDSLNAYDANLQLSYTQAYSVGWQRKVSNDSAIEVRYVGSRHRNDWETVNLNEIGITANGFLNEFKKAQANLQANMAGGKGQTFAYTGIPGTSPLPTFLAFYQGLAPANANDPTKYTSTQFSNSTNLGFLAQMNPNPYGFASTNATSGLFGNSTFRQNGINAGLPANFFVANPDVTSAQLVTNFGGTNANSVQVEFRKRFTKGLAFNTSYTWSNAEYLQRYGYTQPGEYTTQTGTVGNVTHALKGNWLYELPFGRDKKWANNMNGVMDAILGGWEFDGVGRIQTGEMLDFGNVRLVGMTEDDLRKAISLRVDPVSGQIFILPDDIIQNTVKAFQVSATSPNGYSALGAPTGRYLAPANSVDCIEAVQGAGACGARSVVVTAPALVRFDLSMVKKFRIHANINFEFRAEMLNAFNSPYFSPIIGATNTSFAGNGPSQSGTLTTNTTVPTSADGYRLTSLLGDNQSRIIQLVWRVRW